MTMTSGIKTPVFWMSAIGVLAGLLIDLLQPSDACDVTTWITRAAGLVLAGLVSLGYAVGRGRYKAAALALPKPMPFTTEFWVAMVVAMAGAAPVVFADNQCPGDQVAFKVAAALSAALAVVGLGVSRQIGSTPGT